MILSMATNEVHQKLEELLQENTKLKETIKQNNLAMKKQLNTMVSWQEMVVKLHEHHREKFKETTSLIGNLKQENLELKTKLVMQQTEDSEHNFEVYKYIYTFIHTYIYIYIRNIIFIVLYFYSILWYIFSSLGN